MGELVWHDAFLGEALGTSIDSPELFRAAPGVPRHGCRVDVYQYFIEGIYLLSAELKDGQISKRVFIAK